MTVKPALRAVVGALACVLCGAAAAQERYGPHGGGGAPHGGFEMGGRGGAPHGGEGAPRGGFEMGGRGGFPPPREAGGSPYGFSSPYGPPPRYAPPPQPRGYDSAPPRRPNDAPPGWRGALREPPGVVREPGGPAPSRMASLDWVIGSIQRRSPGRQLDANLGYMEGGRPVYIVRWLTQRGRRMDYVVDAQTGAILNGR